MYSHNIFNFLSDLCMYLSLYNEDIQRKHFEITSKNRDCKVSFYYKSFQKYHTCILCILVILLALFHCYLPATLLKASFPCSWPFVLCSSWVSREDCGTMDLELSIWAWRITSGYTTKNNESPSPRICHLPIVQLWQLLWARLTDALVLQWSILFNFSSSSFRNILS